MIDGPLADLATVFDAFIDCLAEMKPDQDARHTIFVGGLREAGVGPQHLVGPATLLIANGLLQGVA